MIQIKTFLLVFALLAAPLMGLQANPNPPVDKLKARNVLLKTSRALGVAHMTVKRTKNYTGKLGRAVKHQRFAKKLYTDGKFERAIFHSRYARILAGEIMKENSARQGSDFSFSAEENTLMAAPPPDNDLTSEVNTDSPADVKDEDLMNGGMNVDIQ